VTERIAAAALKIGDLTVSMVPPARHHTLMRAAEKNGHRERINSEQQGFITSKGRFVRRVEAMQIARAAGQLIVRKSGYMGGEVSMFDELFSEDVWRCDLGTNSAPSAPTSTDAPTRRSWRRPTRHVSMPNAPQV
jgi:exopolysaccharide biosynthesis protein